MRAKILVVGDIILDRYLHGSIERVNPESPGVVFNVSRVEHRLGGAAAVAYLCAGLECQTTLIGTRGIDDAGASICDLMKQAGISDRCPLFGKTTIKERRVASGRLLPDRTDWDCDSEITPAQWKSHLWAYDADRFDCIVVADYGRGSAISAVSALRSQFPSVPIVVDPDRRADWRIRYDGATYIKCNRREAESGTIPASCRKIVTLDSGGIFCDDTIIAAEPRRVVDVTGCGDTVSAVLAWQLAQGADVMNACRLANKAAGLQVERLGVQQIKPEEIEPPGKFCDPCVVASVARRAGKKVVFSNGCFDVFHAGHVATLQHAKRCGDVLIVGINSDSSVRRLKGDKRPIHGQDYRAAVLAALECVDCVAVFDGEPHDLVRAIRPDVLVKGDDCRGKPISGAEWAGRVEFSPLIDGLSSTRAIECLS